MNAVTARAVTMGVLWCCTSDEGWPPWQPLLAESGGRRNHDKWSTWIDTIGHCLGATGSDAEAVVTPWAAVTAAGTRRIFRRCKRDGANYMVSITPVPAKRAADDRVTLCSWLPNHSYPIDHSDDDGE